MWARHFPPGRWSISTNGRVNPLGPHQFLAWSGSDQTFQTRSRGASKMRLMTRTGGAEAPPDLFRFFAGLFATPFADIRFLPLLKFLQVGVEPHEARLPKLAVALNPIRDFPQRCRFQTGGPRLRIAPARDQARVLEDAEVPGDRWQTDAEGLGQLLHCYV